MKRLIWTLHARKRLGERRLRPSWVERATRDPDWTEPDPDDAATERRFRRTPELGDRVLRVAVIERADDIVIKSAMPDRGAARRRP